MRLRGQADFMSLDFVVYTTSVAIVSVGCAAIAYARTRDPFHPAIVISAMLAFLYAFIPYQAGNRDDLASYLTEVQISRVLQLNLLGVIALCMGLLVWTRRARGWSFVELELGSGAQRRALVMAKVLGLAGVLSFVYLIIESGGLSAAYGRAYGGTWHDSGYVREMFLMSAPGILWYFIATARRPLRVSDVLWLVTFSIPLVLHGFLGARRGPTLVIAFTLMMGYVFARRRTPRIAIVVSGGAILGLLVLLLVANRGEIYIGSELREFRGPLEVFEAPETNEFIYGAATIVNAEYFDRYNWGGRYFAQIAIRPIPRAMWPTKYEFASEWLGIGNLEENAGTGLEDFKASVGWRGGLGAAPGIIADSWLEFWWGFFPFLFMIGCFYSYGWYRARNTGGAWIFSFTIMMALSGYLVTQTFEAMIFRFLFMAVPAWIAWRVVVGRGVSGNPAAAFRRL